MSLRKIDLAAPVFDKDSKIITTDSGQHSAEIAWQSISCELVTPIHGGGVEARHSDADLPIRVAAIRGQLRFWWRLLAQHKWKLKDIRKAEFALWGGMNDGDEGGGHASLVFLRVEMENKLQKAPLSDYAKNINDILGYALFTARRTRTGLPEMKLGKEGLRWNLQYCFDQKISDEQKEQVLETLRWWATLGGIGGRTRRGCGVFTVQGLNLVSEQEMRDLGCQILYPGNPENNAKAAWIDAIAAWKEKRREHKEAFRKLLGKNDEHSRHLATVFSRPVYDGSQWRAMVLMLPNSSQEVKNILGKTK